MKGIKHVSVGTELTQAEWESATGHDVDAGTSFPGSPGEKDLFYRTDGHRWYIYDGSAWVQVSGYKEGARAYHDTNQSISDSTWTTLAFNSERWDTDAIHDNSTNNSRLTCKTAGKYLIIFSAEFQANATGRRLLRVVLNGSTQIVFITAGLNSSNESQLTLATIYDLSVNDYVEAQVFQDSGGALNINSTAQTSPEFMMQRIG